jgi:GT2 family glycosyltransferase
VPEHVVVAVVVAFNRRALLLESLSALHGQSRPLDAIVVVDNGSTDGSAAAVEEQLPRVDLVRFDRNTGGAGGFTAGMARALVEHQADLVWLMDDDTIPDPSALETMLRALAIAPSNTSVLASEVRWVDGRLHPMNMPRVRPFSSVRSRREAAAHNCYPVRSASFVSLLVKADAIRRHGLPVADYFLWNDDFEFTARLLRGSNGFVVRNSVVTHKTRVFGSTDVDPGERFYLEVRNKVWLMRLSHALGPIERMLYGGSTVFRWARTILHSKDRRTLWRGLRQGWSDGWLRRPVGNAEVLSERRDIVLDVELLEARRQVGGAL